MRSSWKVAVAVGLLVLPQLAAANDVEEQLLQMQERMSQLEDKLEATSDQLEDSQRRVNQQQQMIERAGLEERAASSGVASFFEQVEFGGWVAASYVYNVNDPANGSNVLIGAPNTGTFFLANPFHPDTNTFQLDQLWFEMSKAATEESRGGFGADLVMGETADALNASTSNGNNVVVYQAYAEYLAPLGPGILFKGGRFATQIGAEVAQTVYNFNITRGLVYSVLQPINHVGLYASTEMDNGFGLGLGVANTALGNLNSDVDNDKTLLWHVTYDEDAWGLKLSGVWGGDNPATSDSCGPMTPAGSCSSKDATGIVDLVVNWDPSENLETWIDLTYLWTQRNGGTGAAGGGVGPNPSGIGIALAGRLAVTEATGFAARGEFLDLNGNLLGTQTTAGGWSQKLWSITGTLDHALTENLMLKGEARYETGSQQGTDNVFYFKGGRNIMTNDQVILAAEMAYRF